jgi:hypothetical protein
MEVGSVENAYVWKEGWRIQPALYENIQPSRGFYYKREPKKFFKGLTPM